MVVTSSLHLIGTRVLQKNAKLAPLCRASLMEGAMVAGRSPRVHTVAQMKKSVNTEDGYLGPFSLGIADLRGDYKASPEGTLKGDVALPKPEGSASFSPFLPFAGLADASASGSLSHTERYSPARSSIADAYRITSKSSPWSAVRSTTTSRPP
jgi:hypothetical protein